MSLCIHPRAVEDRLSAHVVVVRAYFTLRVERRVEGEYRDRESSEQSVESKTREYGARRAALRVLGGEEC